MYLEEATGKQRISKILICSDCLEKELMVDPSTREVVCPDCVQRRLILLKRFGGAIFRRAFYEHTREERTKLLKELPRAI